MAHFILQYVPDRPIKWLTTRLLTSELSVIIVQTLSFGFVSPRPVEIMVEMRLQLDGLL